MKRRTNDEFIAKSKAMFGKNTFIYDRVDYKNNMTNVVIGCPKHSYFTILPCHHFRHPYGGCKECLKENKKTSTCGFGINDVLSGSADPLFCKWQALIERCYNAQIHEKYPTYQDCTVCDEWRYLSNFLKWAHNSDNGYREGYELDKDILVKGNKVYSPQTCCFVPRDINIILASKPNKNGLPKGVGIDKRCKSNRYYAQIHCGEQKWLGTYDSPEEAFDAYKKAKESYLREQAEKFYTKGEITERVYNALMNYKVEITD